MNDQVAPYEKAIEETARTVGKAIDVVRETAHAIRRPTSNLFNFLVGDRLQAARDRNLDELLRKTAKIIDERDVAEKAFAPEQIVIPLLEAAAGEPREELQTLWSHLLANAMDPARCDDVRPEFIATLQRLQPIDALTLRTCLRAGASLSTIETVHLDMNGKARESQVVISLKTLVSEGCMQNRQGYYEITAFGEELLHACDATDP